MTKTLKALAVCLGVVAICVPLFLWLGSPARLGVMSTTDTAGPGPNALGVATTSTPALTSTTLASTTLTSTTEPMVTPSTVSTSSGISGHSASTVTTSAAGAPATIRVAFVGDVLTHLQIVNSAYDSGTGVYDFAPLFAPVAPYLSAADYAVANLETRLAGAQAGFSGYPLLNSPDELAAGLKGAGVDLLATANNHSLDQGWTGLAATLDTIDAAGLAHVGTYRSQAERDAPLIVDVGGVKLAFLNYTAETNGIPVPADHRFAVNILDPKTVGRDVKTARARGAELVIAILHYGNEYMRVPSDLQVKVSDELLAEGVDAIVGSHPHVVEPIARVEEPGGSSNTGNYVAYSLGNFVSGQRWRYSDSGIVLYLDIEKDRSGARVTGAEYLPVYVQRGEAGDRVRYRVVPVLPGLPPLSDVPFTADAKARMGQVWDELYTLLDRPGDGIRPLDPKELGLSLGTSQY